MPSLLPISPAAPMHGGWLDPHLRARLEHARAVATAALLAERNREGSWTGELSASALSTATAVAALTIYGRANHAAGARLGELIRGGREWLVRHQNADGGWGDTTKSRSNISTTTLVWAALGLDAGADEAGDRAAQAVAAAERWLTGAAGGLEPRRLVAAIEQRYGEDRTFSIPILTMCALCGRLGPEPAAWAYVRQLPFEIAALPQGWFGALRLPVVSYALPALIAIGQVRHATRPTRNPVLRVLRDRCRDSTLAKLARLQPENGGFLEATPLTSFVTMSLAAIGLAQHAVVERGVAFLERSARADGSWPIDTNLATWVTTLSVLAVADAPEWCRGSRDRDAARSVRDALLRQQGRERHPYTLAAPGGWAWTGLPGGVPDADDTAGALLALAQLGPVDERVVQAACAGVTWLLDLQNRDGGIPTFCRGWGKLPFDRSSPDLTAHAIRAWVAWRSRLEPAVQRRIDVALQRAGAFLRGAQRADGAWIPLWFGHQDHPADENPVYGTARVIPALCATNAASSGPDRESFDRGVSWLICNQNRDGGWSGAPGVASSAEETGLALEALAAAWTSELTRDAAQTALRDALRRGAEWLVAAVEHGTWREPAPIGFYFAKLWYFERLYPQIFTTAALNRLAALA